VVPADFAAGCLLHARLRLKRTVDADTARSVSERSAGRHLTPPNVLGPAEKRALDHGDSMVAWVTRFGKYRLLSAVGF
jgi:hypothetical protein